MLIINFSVLHMKIKCSESHQLSVGHLKMSFNRHVLNEFNFCHEAKMASNRHSDTLEITFLPVY